ncbi:MAG: hypothetical protein AAGD86_07455, partial [Pseudomonadota bacterium]
KAPSPLTVGWGLALKARLAAAALGALLAVCACAAAVAVIGWLWVAVTGPSMLLAALGTAAGSTVYGIVLCIGAALLLLLAKPLLAGRPREQAAVVLDPHRQRALYSYVRSLARSIGAPEPAALRVDSSVGLRLERRARLAKQPVLTIGLPLLLGLRTHSVSALLVRELAHRAQAPGLRAGRFLTAVYRGLHRAVNEDDLWDRRVAALRRNGGRFAAVAGRAGALAFAAARRGLRPLLALCAALSRGPLSALSQRQDALAITLCGSANFERALTELRRLQAAAALAARRSEAEWQNGRLVDNLPALTALLAREVEDDDDPPALEEPTVSPPWRAVADDAERLALARELDAPSLLRRSGSARRLLYSRAELGRRVTFFEYRQQGLKFSDKHLVPVADFTAGADEPLHDRRDSLRRLFGKARSSDRVLVLPSLPRLRGADPAGLPAAVERARQRWQEVAGEATAVVQRREELLHRLRNLRIAKALVKGEVAIDAAEFELPSAEPETVDAQLDATVGELRAMERALGEFEQRQALYLATTLASGCAQGLCTEAELSLSLNALNMLRQHAGSITELEALSQELNTLAALPGRARTAAVEQAIADGTAALNRQLAAFRATLHVIQNPLNVDRTLAQEIAVWASEPDAIARDPVLAASTAVAVARCLRQLNTDIIAQVADVAERVAAAARERVANGYR